MKSDQTASANGRTPASSDDSGSSPVPEGLQAKCRHQAMVIETLGEVLSTFERGARALKAENSALRAENDRLRRHRRFASRPDRRVTAANRPKWRSRSACRRPASHGASIAQWLADHVAPSVLETALLLVSELVRTVSATVACRKAKTSSCVLPLARRLSAGSRGSRPDGVIAPQPPDLLRGGGMGLHLVQTLSERWGVVRAAEGPTCVWAQLPRQLRLELALARGEEAVPCRD